MVAADRRDVGLVALRGGEHTELPGGGHVDWCTRDLRAADAGDECRGLRTRCADADRAVFPGTSHRSDIDVVASAHIEACLGAERDVARAGRVAIQRLKAKCRVAVAGRIRKQRRITRSGQARARRIEPQRAAAKRAVLATGRVVGERVVADRRVVATGRVPAPMGTGAPRQLNWERWWS